MINLPPIKVLVDNKFLTNSKQTGFTEAYLLAVDCRKNSFIRFTVYLQTGALWSGLPINAIWCDKFAKIEYDEKDCQTLQPYSCLEGPISIISYDLLKNGCLQTTDLGVGYYLFTINYEGEGLSEDPEQYKTHNIVVLSSGRLAALPNNKIRFFDNWFTDNNSVFFYERSSKHYFPGG